jgi:prolyl oligopeptidase
MTGGVDTPREPVTDTYHGVEVTDDYRWLEDGSSERTRAWTAAQDTRARAYLEAIPQREPIRRRFAEILTAESTDYLQLQGRGSRFFALKKQPPRQQPFLVVLDRLDDTSGERVLLDPDALDPSGSTAIDWFVPSPDGSLVAVSLSEKGTEDGTLHLYVAETGRPVDVPIPRVNSGTAGGSLAWRDDSGGFWYTRHPAPGERPDTDLGFFQEVWFHELGSEVASDRPELAGVFAEDRIAESFLDSSPDGRWVMDRVQKGDGGEWQLFLRAQDGSDWRLVADVDELWVDAVFGSDALFVLSLRDAPHGQVLRLPLYDGVTAADASVLIPAGPTTIETVAVTRGRVWVVDLDGGPSGVRAFAHNGTPLPEVELPDVCSVEPLLRLGDDLVGWAVETFVSPRTWWVHEDEDLEPRRTALDTVAPVTFEGVDVQRVLATSRDGTRVPVNLIARAGTPRDGTAPALLLGYGGYAISLKPWFQPAWLPWLEQGGVMAVANIRGGGEYGQEWHHAGRLDAKQHCFDDLIACADHLVASGVTRRDRLAIMGGSNGGLLMGAVLTQRPDVARAVVCAVPVLDALRSETTPNGQFNTTEFGSVHDEHMFRALLAYSPYHHVQDGTSYPAVLLTAGEFDPRVDAWHAKKMCARLQAATGDQPVLLRMESGGHGMGQSLDQLVALQTDYFTFLFDRLGLHYDPARETG